MGCGNILLAKDSQFSMQSHPSSACDLVGLFAEGTIPEVMEHGQLGLVEVLEVKPTTVTLICGRL